LRDCKTLYLYSWRAIVKIFFLHLSFEKNYLSSIEVPPFLLGVAGLFVSLCLDIGITEKSMEYCKVRIAAEGDSFFTTSLPMLDKALIHGLGSGAFVCPSGYKRMTIKAVRGREKPSALPYVFYDLFKKVFGDNGELLDNASPGAIAALRQLTGFAYKTKLPYKSEDEARVTSGFVETDAELSAYQFDGDPFTSRMQFYVEKIFTGYDRSESNRNGPGVTADTEFKAKLEAVIPATDFTFSRVPSYFFNGNDQFERSDREPVWDHQSLFQQPFRAKVLLVPKDSRGPRLISAEPCLQQFMQQGIKDYFVRVLENHPLTKGAVNFADQTINQTVAQLGSLDQSWSTLDLKEASDRISNDLVIKLFQNIPDLLEDLQGTRTSRTILPNGKILKMNKFAPMGSAMCFPMLATVVYLSTFVCLELCGVPPSKISEYIRVYGDDIAIRTEYSSVITAALEHVGLKVNIDKSFRNSRFCESCGVDAFDGHDVTPVRLREWIPTTKIEKQSQWTATLLVSINQTANQMWMLGYRKAPEYLYTLLERYVGRLPFGYQHSSFLCRMTPPEADAWTLSSSQGELKHIRGSKEPTVRVPVVRSQQNEHTILSWGAHMMRTWPLLGQNMDIPEIGEIPATGSSLRLIHVDVPESAFSKYPGSTWLPGPGPVDVGQPTVLYDEDEDAYGRSTISDYHHW
jgi:hypothetical protein